MLETRGVLEQAEALFARRPSWVAFYREVLGPDGLVRTIYASQAEREEFESSEAYGRIQQMLGQLRDQDADLPGGPREPTRVITVRLPKSLHDSLKIESHEHQTSMNKLCISKLLVSLNSTLQVLEGEIASGGGETSCSI